MFYRVALLNLLLLYFLLLLLNLLLLNNIFGLLTSLPPWEKKMRGSNFLLLFFAYF